MASDLDDNFMPGTPEAETEENFLNLQDLYGYTKNEPREFDLIEHGNVQPNVVQNAESSSPDSTSEGRPEWTQISIKESRSIPELISLVKEKEEMRDHETVEPRQEEMQRKPQEQTQPQSTQNFDTNSIEDQQISLTNIDMSMDIQLDPPEPQNNFINKFKDHDTKNGRPGGRGLSPQDVAAYNKIKKLLDLGRIDANNWDSIQKELEVGGNENSSGENFRHFENFGESGEDQDDHQSIDDPLHFTQIETQPLLKNFKRKKKICSSQPSVYSNKPINRPLSASFSRKAANIGETEPSSSGSNNFTKIDTSILPVLSDSQIEGNEESSKDFDLHFSRKRSGTQKENNEQNSPIKKQKITLDDQLREDLVKMANSFLQNGNQEQIQGGPGLM